MALTDKLTNIADAIRTKTGTNASMTLDEMPSKIESIINTPNLQDKLVTITENGTINIVADEGYNGLNNVEVTTIVGSESEDNVNIFLQETEPTTKEGLWLQTSKTYDKIAFRNVELGTNWDTKTSTIPTISNMNNATGERVGDFVYLFGAGAWYSAYKYSLIDGTCTQIKNTIYRNSVSPSAVVGTDIYLFGYWDYYYLTKYDTLTETYTTMAKPLNNLTGSGVTVVGDYIYTFGSDAQGHSTYVTRYDTLTDTWERLSDFPVQITNPYPVTHGTDIYLIEPYTYSGYAMSSYKYDTLTDTFTVISRPPDEFLPGACYVEDDYIYLFGGTTNSFIGTRSYRYNILTDTYTKLSDIQRAIAYNNNTIIEYEGKHLAFGGRGYGTQLLELSIERIVDEIPEYAGDILIIETNSTANKSFKLFNDDKIISDISERNTYYFNDVVYQSENGENDTSIPTYYGDGTQWVRFKN